MAQIDASIPLAVRLPQIRDPLEVYGNALSIVGLEQANEARARQMQTERDAAARARAEEDALRSFYASDRGKNALAVLASASPKAFRDEQRRALEEADKSSEIDKRRADTRKTDSETKIKQGERAAQLLRAAVDQQTWTAVRDLIGQEAGPDMLKSIPLEFNPQLRDMMLQATIKEVDRLSQQRDNDNALVQRDAAGQPVINEVRVAAGERIARAGVPTTPVQYLQGVDERGQPTYYVAPTNVPRGGPMPTPVPTGIRTPAAAKDGKSADQQRKVMTLLNEADGLIGQATGSMLGAGKDVIASAMGNATEGAKATAQLKIVEAGLIANMPRMEGPQSDRDVQLYREAAGQIGNPTVPREIKKAALATIRRLNEQYAAATSRSAPATDPSKVEELLRKYGQ